MKQSYFQPQVLNHQVFEIEFEDQCNQPRARRKKKIMRYNEPRTKNFGLINNCLYVTEAPDPLPRQSKPACRIAANKRMVTTTTPDLDPNPFYICSTKKATNNLKNAKMIKTLTKPICSRRYNTRARNQPPENR